jgi:ABC-type polysaccharide/polyol phosphate transport system ATPase subunit
MTPSLVFDGVWKRFRRGKIHDSLRDLVPATFRRLIGREPKTDADRRYFWAIRDLSFEVKPGDVLGIIGGNGAGKSTTLKILNRIMEPTAGIVKTTGTIGALIEVSAGFHQDLTGRQNVYLQGAIMGMRKAEVQRKFDEIVEFSGIADFIDTPVKRYSSGMNARLGFSIAAHLEPDILIIDEVLAVGDAAFQTKAFGRIKEMATAGAPVVLVSHQLDRIAELCTKAILLDHGAVRTSGTPMECINEYLHGATSDPSGESSQQGIRFQRIIAPNGSAVHSGEDLTVIVEGTADLDNPPASWSPAVRVIDLRTGANVHAVTGLQREIPLPVHGEFKYRLTFQMNVAPGAYDVDVHIWDSMLHTHPIPGIRLRVEVLERMPFYGGVQLNSRWEAQKTGAPGITVSGDGVVGRHIA